MMAHDLFNDLVTVEPLLQEFIRISASELARSRVLSSSVGQLTA